MVLNKRTKPSSVGRTSSGPFLIVPVEIFRDIYDTRNACPTSPNHRFVSKGLPSWTMIKRLKLLNSTLTIDNGMLTPTLKVRRGKVNEFFAA